MLFVCDSLVHWWSVVTLAILQTVGIHCANWVAGAYRGNLPTVCQYWWGSLCHRLWKWLDIVLRKVNRNVMPQEFAGCVCQLESFTERPASCYEGHGFESGSRCGLLSLRVSVVFSPSTRTNPGMLPQNRPRPPFPCCFEFIVYWPYHIRGHTAKFY
jgi:hypothetical protein